MEQGRNKDLKPKAVPIAWLLVNILISAATFAVTWLYYDHIPERIPTQFDMGGNVTNWSDKDSFSLWFLPSLQLGLTVFMMWVNWMVVLSTTSMATDPKKKPFNNITASRTRDFMCALNLVIVVSMFFSQLVSISLLDFTVWNSYIFIGLIAAIVLATAWLIWVIPRDMKRLREKYNEDIDWKEEKRWKLGGQLYYNPEDPHVMVEKRYGVGATFNMARWQGWVFLGLIFVMGFLPLIIMIWAV